MCRMAVCIPTYNRVNEIKYLLENELIFFKDLNNFVNLKNVFLKNVPNIMTNSLIVFSHTKAEPTNNKQTTINMMPATPKVL